ncbi:MAG TPA: hypothetical protein VKR42_13385 [Ktedonobacteraceae bacterium]|nr:hypothetical protein [Ktedonobacteraceae bacterium]
MSSERVYAAPSLSEVVKQLLNFQLTGVLTIWQATGTRQENTKIIFERGRPISIYRGVQREAATSGVLNWLNTWGEIHFTFAETVSRLQLPAPNSTSRVSQSTTSLPTVPPIRPLDTQPVPTTTQSNQSTLSTQPTQPITRQNTQETARLQENLNGSGRTQELPLTQEFRRGEVQRKEVRESNAVQLQYIEYVANSIAPDRVMPALTASGSAFPITQLPRYDRTIFLLINGRRTAADLSLLTKRPYADVYATLNRLQYSRLITMVLIL